MEKSFGNEAALNWKAPVTQADISEPLPSSKLDGRTFVENNKVYEELRKPTGNAIALETVQHSV